MIGSHISLSFHFLLFPAGALDLLGEKITTPLENFMKTVHLERAWPVVLEFGISYRLLFSHHVLTPVHPLLLLLLLLTTGKSSLTAAWMPEYGRYAALGITDSSMFIVPMSKKPPHNPVDDKYCVELMFKNIVSFDVSVEEAKGMKKGLIGVETNMTITDDNGDEYAIRLQEHSRFYKLVLAAWDSCTIRKASGSGEVSAELDKYLAEQYHDESLQCLQLTKKIDEVEKIFNEYAEECFLDLRLKEWTIEKREMFAIAIKWIRRCWGKLTKDERNLFTKRELSPQRQFEIDAVRSLSPEKVAENERDKENKLKLVAYRRMKCIQACLNMIVSCLYSSEVCDHKICLLHGPYPLESYDWVQVLMEDALECVYKSLGIKIDAKVESLAAEEIEQTMSRTFRNSQSHGVSTFPSMNFSSSPSSSMMDERQGPLSGRISAVVKNFDDDILTPMKQRFFEQYNLQGQFSSKLDDNIQKLVRSIRDMQAFALFELAKVTAVGRVNKEKSRQDQYKAVSPLGYTITRFPWWTVGIEALVIRVSGLLDDILSSQEVFDHFNRKIRIKTKRKPLSALIDDVIADDYTGYGRPAEHNQSVPPSPTKQDYNDGLVSSSLEGSFSPMRNISQSKTPRGKISNKSASPRDVVCISALETQEILLFTIVHLLQSLCKDSSKIRELFRYELADYWLSIFNVVNKLCPRPDVIVQSYGADHPKVLRSPSRLNKSTKSTKKKSLSGKNPPRKPSGGPIDEKGEEPAYGHCVYVSGIPPTSITDFGEAKYGMTKATWQLLIKSRLAVEVVYF